MALWLEALDSIDEPATPAAAPAPAEDELVCEACGRIFEKADQVCGACGAPRPRALDWHRVLPPCRSPAAFASAIDDLLAHLTTGPLDPDVALVASACARTSPAQARVRAVAVVHDRESGRVVDRASWSGALVGRIRPRMTEIRLRAMAMALHQLRERPDVLVLRATALPEGDINAPALGCLFDLPSLAVGPARGRDPHRGEVVHLRPGAPATHVVPGHRADLATAVHLARALCPPLGLAPLRPTTASLPTPVAQAMASCASSAL